MTAVTEPSSDLSADEITRSNGQPGTTIATYGYDGLGRRISNNPAGGRWITTTTTR